MKQGEWEYRRIIPPVL